MNELMVNPVRISVVMVVFLMLASGLVASVIDVRAGGQTIYFIRGGLNLERPAFFLSVIQGGGAISRDVALVDGSSEFVSCANHEAVYLERKSGAVMHLDIKEGTQRQLGKTAYKPEHEIRNKFILNMEKKYLIAVLNEIGEIGVIKGTKNFTVAKYLFSGEVDILYKGNGNVSAIQHISDETIRIYLSGGYFDFSLNSRKILQSNNIEYLRNMEIALIKSDVVIYSNDMGGVDVQKMLTRDVVARIEFGSGFVIPLDLNIESGKLLLIRVANPGGESFSDELVEFSLEKLQTVKRGSGAPVIDGCYAQG